MFKYTKQIPCVSEAKKDENVQGMRFPLMVWKSIKLPQDYYLL